MLKTVRDWYRFAVSQFEEREVATGQNFDNRPDEAGYLVLRGLRLPVDKDPTLFLDARLTEREQEHLSELLRRRVEERIPTAYLTREIEWAGMGFYVDERVLIPRSYFTEVLPGMVEPWIPEPERVGRVLELCTGCGCIAVLLAKIFPGAEVVATEISAEAMEVARVNVNRFGLEGRIQLARADVWEGVPSGPYDLIVANPPYEPTGWLERMPPEYRKEPRLALDGGPDGLDVVRKIVAQARRWLSRDGVLILEVGGLQEALEAAFPSLPLEWLKMEDGSYPVCLARAEHLPEEPAEAKEPEEKAPAVKKPRKRKTPV